MPDADFPVKCRPGRIAGVTASGERIGHDASRAGELAPVLDQLVALRVVLRREQLPAVAALFERSMPRLESLCVEGDIQDQGGASAGAPTPPPLLNLLSTAPQNLPALKNVVAKNVLVSLPMSVWGNLRKIHLENTSVNSPPQLPGLGPLAAALRSCTQLEELHLNRYLTGGGVYVPPAGPRQQQSLGHLSQLRKITIADSPSALLDVLASFIIPEQVTVKFVVYAVKNPFQVLFSIFYGHHDLARSSLPIIQKAKTIKVCHYNGVASVSATTTPTGARFDFNVVEDDMRAGQTSLQDQWGETSTYVLPHRLSVFHGGHVETLVVSGYLNGVPAEAWAITFDLFPRLRTLEFEDTYAECPGSLDAVMKALLSNSISNPGRKVGHWLRDLKITGFLYDNVLLEGLYAYLTERTKVLRAPPFQTLDIRLAPDRNWSPAAVADYRRKLASLVPATTGTVSLIILPPGTDPFRRGVGEASSG